MKMLLKNNLLENVIIISCSGTIIFVLLNCITNISPLGGVWFLLYILTLFIVSVFISFKFIQWLLCLNKPLKYDMEDFNESYPYLTFLKQILPETRKKTKHQEWKEYDTNELSVISTVLERRLVSSWYVPYISEEIGFPFACKQMLDQIIGKTFQICNKIETKDVYVDICTILVSHLKEYKKALKRCEKSPSSPVELLYKKSHSVSENTNKKYSSADYCTNILRIIIKELVQWELWETPHSELLVRILAKKLDSFINNTLADPLWLNDKLLNAINNETLKQNVATGQQKEPEYVSKPETVESKLPKMNDLPSSSELNVKGNQEKQTVIENKVEEVAVNNEPLDVKSSPILRQRRGRQGRNEVKIYDRIIEGSVKTWETDIDLQCISLGQDLLASFDGEITLSRLWGQDTEPDGSPDHSREKSPQPLWFGEEDTIDLDLKDSSPQRDHKKEHSPKPADALLKDLQTTVSQAKTKIGDLQVGDVAYIDVHTKSYSDEAAGMMEGLLDFGIAGLKKGLRFTGLSDDSQDKSPSHHRFDKTPPELNKAKPFYEHKDVTSTSILKEESGNSNVPPLLKQHRVISQDSVPSQPKPISRVEYPPLLLSDSPEPQYEEVADLSTSIAKLRCLLAEAAPRYEINTPSAKRGSDDIWWESAEETRGRTQHHHSTRPVDTATLADEYDMSMERNSSPGQTSNNMQRLDKLFQRTVTGVFNSIKTAVGAEAEGAEGAGGGAPAAREWAYVTTPHELSSGGAVARLVGARRGLAHVDAALDSLHHLAPSRTCLCPCPCPCPGPGPCACACGVAPEDYDEWCSVFGWGWSATCEAAGAAGLCRSHVAHRVATLLLADLAESLINLWLEELTVWLREQVFVLFEQMSTRDATTAEPKGSFRPFDVDETCAAVLDKIPGLFYLFGDDTLKSAVKLTVTSFSHKEVNRDVAFRILDLLALHFKNAAGLRNPSFDSN